jgi:Arc/MetJ-type ribon-helix-helix transcriptional regulator
VKVSISLPEDDVEFLDAYAQSQGIESRSAAVHEAVRLLRLSGLGEAYEQAFTSWDDEGQAAAWDVAAADGLEKRCAAATSWPSA